MDFFLVGAIIALFLNVCISTEIILGLRRIKRLGDISPLDNEKLPKVSVIVPALNEADAIERALTSVLEMDYDNIEVIVVNDRSTDGTQAVLERMKAAYPTLKTFLIKKLPDGWLGKNHALYKGAQIASGDYLLFTDADIVFEKSALRRAVNHVKKHNLDHLCMFFDFTGAGSLLNAMVLEVAGSLLILLKPWKVRKPNPKWYMGVGAFNMVAADAYKKAGEHKAVAMCPVDDIMLGKLIKKHGFRQDCLIGRGYVSVKWYSSVPELSNGTLKNIFALFDYDLAKVIAATAFQFLVGVLPIIGIFITHGPTRILSISAVVVRIASFMKSAADAGMNPLCGLWAPITPAIGIFNVWRAAITTIANKGICWRGTHYSLANLKAGMI